MLFIWFLGLWTYLRPHTSNSSTLAQLCSDTHLAQSCQKPTILHQLVIWRPLLVGWRPLLLPILVATMLQSRHGFAPSAVPQACEVRQVTRFALLSSNLCISSSCRMLSPQRKRGEGLFLELLYCMLCCGKPVPRFEAFSWWDEMWQDSV